MTELIRYCSICKGSKPFTGLHVISAVHMTNIRKLPPDFWLHKDECKKYNK